MSREESSAAELTPRVCVPWRRTTNPSTKEQIVGGLGFALRKHRSWSGELTSNLENFDFGPLPFAANFRMYESSHAHTPGMSRCCALLRQVFKAALLSRKPLRPILSPYILSLRNYFQIQVPLSETLL